MSLGANTKPSCSKNKNQDDWKNYFVIKINRERAQDPGDPVALARHYLDGADIVLVEGFQAASLPKIEVFRKEVGPRPLYVAGAPNAGEWVALVTDDEKLDAACPVLRFRDTMWLQLLANLAWEKAQVL